MVMKFLQVYKVQPNPKDLIGRTPLDLAIKYKRDEVVLLFKEIKKTKKKK